MLNGWQVYFDEGVSIHNAPFEDISGFYRDYGVFSSRGKIEG